MKPQLVLPIDEAKHTEKLKQFDRVLQQAGNPMHVYNSDYSQILPLAEFTTQLCSL